ncbi:hypothetical protein IGI37_000075 [Enterococcus sp. AZ194]|uniref:hypothetical protein n=1 Tax=Enterococcus sp. AZ194 TaxID=2774629 RepID=UPI003F27B120
MKGKKYRTRYKTIVPKNLVGICIDEVNTYVRALKIKFDNGECFWFMLRDLEAIEHKAAIAFDNTGLSEQEIRLMIDNGKMPMSLWREIMEGNDE